MLPRYAFSGTEERFRLVAPLGARGMGRRPPAPRTVHPPQRLTGEPISSKRIVLSVTRGRLINEARSLPVERHAGCWQSSFFTRTERRFSEDSYKLPYLPLFG